MCVWPDVSNQWMLLFLLLQQVGQVSSHTQRVTLQILFHNHIQHSQTDGAWHGVPSKLGHLKHTEWRDHERKDKVPRSD